MIVNSQIVSIGKLVKPHGVNGEIVALTDYDIDFANIKCIVINIDGINIPFFINQTRTRGHGAYLITIDGIENENDAITLCGKELFVLNNDCTDDCENEDGFYATDLIGYCIINADNGTKIGEITDIEDSTENALFIAEHPNGDLLYIPIANEFIVEISTETSTIIMNLPTGLIELN